MKKKTYIRPFIIITVILVAAMFYSLPYYVSKPGMAKALEPIIEVEDGYEEEGNFLLTTVRMGRANIYSYLAAKIGDYQEIYPIEMILDGKETEEEYATRQMYLMESSKLNAIEVAYRKANIPIEYRYKGVYVLNVLQDMPAYGKLMTGDRITKVDGKAFHSSENFIKHVSGKKVGDTVRLTYVRSNKTSETSVPLQKFKSDPSKIGVGITLVDDKEILVDPNVLVKTDEIGGPSAGLMFSLEIYNQLTESDLTRGYDVAGTGTISANGEVGPIGGIQQKIVAADKSNADIFFAPNEKGASGSNYREALVAGKDIRTKMKIVPIDSFEDAVNYLEGLEDKKD